MAAEERHARGEAPTQGLGARARAGRTENMPCMSVTLDVSKLTGWLNADAPCRVERRARDAGRGVDREAGGRGGGGASGVHGEGPTQGVRVRARAERTENIWRMVVTLDVSQLEMSALKFFEFWKRKPMSVMAETHQSAMAP